MNPMGLILLITLSIMLLVFWPTWPYTQQGGWGYKASGMVAVLLAVIVLLILMDVLAFI